MKILNITPDKAILRELGSRLNLMRKQQGYSQEELAKEAGLGVATLRRIEDGSDSQMGSWLKLLKTLQLSHSIENLLPETYLSPYAQVKAQNKGTRSNKAKSGAPVKSTKSIKSVETVSEPTKKIIWGDEQV